MLLALPTQPKMGYYCVEQCLQTDRNFATFSCISHKRIVWLLDDYDQSISILSIICILFNKCRLLTWTPVDSDFIGFSRSTVLLNKCRLAHLDASGFTLHRSQSVDGFTRPKSLTKLTSARLSQTSPDINCTSHSLPRTTIMSSTVATPRTLYDKIWDDHVVYVLNSTR